MAGICRKRGIVLQFFFFFFFAPSDQRVIKLIRRLTTALCSIQFSHYSRYGNNMIPSQSSPARWSLTGMQSGQARGCTAGMSTRTDTDTCGCMKKQQDTVNRDIKLCIYSGPCLAFHAISSFNQTVSVVSSHSTGKFGTYSNPLSFYNYILL